MELIKNPTRRKTWKSETTFEDNGEIALAQIQIRSAAFKRVSLERTRFLCFHSCEYFVNGEFASG